MGALDWLACSTRRIMRASVESPPTRSARILRYPARLNVPLITRSPAALSTGMLSPVRSDSSRAACPSSIMPSTGIRCPVFTTTRSPERISSSGTACSAPSCHTSASWGTSFTSPFTAAFVFR